MATDFSSPKNPETPKKKIRKEEALAYHSTGRPGKIEVVPTKPCATARDLSRLIDVVRGTNATTVFSETLVTPASRATVCASFGEMSVSKKTVVVPERRTVSTSRAMSFAVGSASGVSPSSGICTRPYRRARYPKAA